jgi:cephalosporin hydroxylase
MIDTSNLATMYEHCRTTPSDINEHLPMFVALVDELGASQVVELGTRTGVSTVAWLYALKCQGHLWSVDVDVQPPIGEHKHWSFLQGDDCSVSVYSQLPSSVDIVFIDTSHEYDHTLRELNLYRWLIRPGGKILLHDTELQHPWGVRGPAFPVKTAVTEFCEAEGLEWENHPNNNGLGVISL